jgi:hypothetical protein
MALCEPGEEFLVGLFAELLIPWHRIAPFCNNRANGDIFGAVNWRMLKTPCTILGLTLLFAPISDAFGQSSQQAPTNQAPKTEDRPTSDQRETVKQPFAVNGVPPLNKQPQPLRRQPRRKSKLLTNDSWSVIREIKFSSGWSNFLFLSCN